MQMYASFLISPQSEFLMPGVCVCVCQYGSSRGREAPGFTEMPKKIAFIVKLSPIVYKHHHRPQSYKPRPPSQYIQSCSITKLTHMKSQRNRQ